MALPFRLLAYLVVAAIGAQGQVVKPYLRIETGAHAAEAKAIDVDAAERFLVSASLDKTARVWELRSGKLLKILRPPVGNAQEGWLYAVAISPDGATVVAGGFTGPDNGDQPIYVFERESGVIRRAITGLRDVTTHLAFSKDGRYVAAALSGNGIRIFETGSYSEVARDVEYGGNCNWVEFDRSSRLVSASSDGVVRLYSSDFHLLHKAKSPGGGQPYSARFSPDGRLIAVGFFDRVEVHVISGADLSPKYDLETPVSEVNLATVLWSDDGRRVCAAGRYSVDSVYPLFCWDARGKGKRSTFPVAGNTIMDLRALQDGVIAFCSFDGALGVLDRGGNIRWRSAPDLLEYLAGASFPQISRDGDRVETDSYYFNGSAWTRQNIGFSVSGQRLAVGVDPQSSLEVPLTTGLAVDNWHDHFHPTLNGRALALQANEISRSLAIASRKDAFVLGTEWNLRKFDRQGAQVWETSVPGSAWRVNVTEDERFVIALLGDGTVRWYTFKEGKEVLALFVDRDLRRWVAWNPDGFFTFQNGGDSLIGYQINRGHDHEGQFVKVDQLREIFYQPDLIAQILKPEAASALVAARNRIGDVSRILSAGLPPEIELISSPQETVAGDYLSSSA